MSNDLKGRLILPNKRDLLKLLRGKGDPTSLKLAAKIESERASKVRSGMEKH